MNTTEFHFTTFINCTSSKEAFSTITACLPLFVHSEPWVMAVVTGGDIRNGVADYKLEIIIFKM